MTRSNAELQDSVSKLQHDVAQLESRMDTQFQLFRSEFESKLQTLFETYLGTKDATNDKEKGILGPPPGSSPKDQGPETGLEGEESINRTSSCGSNRTFQLKCPKFDGSDFKGWWAKMEQYFEAEGVPEGLKVRTVMLQLEGRALQWHHFFAKTQGGMANLTWSSYLQGLRSKPILGNIMVYLRVRRGVELAIMDVFDGESGYTDYEGLLGGLHKSVIRKGFCTTNDQLHSNRSYPISDVIPSDSPNVVQTSKDCSSSDIRMPWGN